MKKKLYLFAIFFLALLAVGNLLHGLFYFQLGGSVVSLQSFLEWYVLILILNIVSTFVMMKYYHFKKYRLTFLMSILIVITSLYYFFILYNMVARGELRDYFANALLIILGASLLYYISLLFSISEKRPWLKTAGIVGIIIVLISGSAFIWSLNTQDAPLKVTLGKILNWTSLAGGILIPIFYIMNFLSELKVLKLDNEHKKRQNRVYVLMVFIGVIAFSSMLFLAGKLSNESQGAIRWNNRGTENAQRMAEPFEARTYVNSENDTLRYRLMMPKNYDPSKKYPLAVCLHGGGGWGTDNVIQIEGSWAAQFLMMPRNRNKYDAIIFVPQCPPGYSWGGGLPNYPGIADLVFEAMAALEETIEIDEKRRYVIGESLGGYGSWQFISKRPKMFAAAVPISGGGDPSLTKNIVDVPIWAFHGAKDRTVPARLSREMIEGIKEAGGNKAVYTEFPDAGHLIFNEVRETPGLIDWIFAQKRD